MCLFDVKQCKRVGISIEEGGVSNNTQEAQHPFNVSTPPRRRWFKMQVRQKELESVTNAVPLASNSDDAAPNVATVNIGSAKAIRSWIPFGVTKYDVDSLRIQVAGWARRVLGFPTS